MMEVSGRSRRLDRGRFLSHSCRHDNMFGGLAILLAFLAIGELLAAILVPLPGNVIGMILLTGALLSGRLTVAAVKRASDLLLDNLAFLFVPPGVGIMVHASTIADSWAVIAGAIVASTLIVLVLVGVLQQRLGRVDGKHEGEEQTG